MAVIEQESTQSFLRKVTKGPRRRIAEKIHQTFPSLTPNQLSYIGTGLVMLGAWGAYKINSNPNYRAKIIPSIAVTLLAFIPQGVDGLDGQLADIYDEEGLEHNRNFGASLDAALDGVQEMALALSTATAGAVTSNPMVEKTSYVAGLTSMVPRTLRSLAESKGILVKESSNGILGFFGTRFGRAILNSIATGFPEYWGVPIGPLMHTFMAGSNIYSSLERLKLLLSNNPPMGLSQEKQQEAKAKVLPLVVTGVGAVLNVGTFYLSHKRR